MTIVGILGALVMLALIKLVVHLMKSIGKEVVSTTKKKKKREIIDDINIKPKRTKKP